MDKGTFDYLRPSAEQLEVMAVLRAGAFEYARKLEQYLPEGPDKTYTLRKLREVAMWANVCVTRQADGTPRPPGAFEEVGDGRGQRGGRAVAD